MIVKQAAHVLDLLEYFVEVKKPATLPEISAAFGWPRSSTYNLLTTLAERGFLYEPRPRAGYYPSTRWISLVQGISETQLLPDNLCQAVEEAARSTAETVAVAAPARTNAILLYIVESPAAIRFAAEVGHQVPIHATACGRALLAQYTPGERSAVLKKIKYEKYMASSVVSADEVEEEIARATKRGWHQNIEGHASDLTGIALPVILPDRRLSVVVGGPTGRLQEKVPKIAATLKRTLKRHGLEFKVR